MTTLDALFVPSLAAPILLKIDVQGYETGSLAAQVPAEAGSMGADGGRIRPPLRRRTLIHGTAGSDAYGFRFARPVNFHQSSTTREIIEMDASFEQVAPAQAMSDGDAR